MHNITTALQYARRGWYVLPLHTPKNGQCSCGDSACDHIGKHPRVCRWQTVASCDPTLIANWWRLWPNANIGILTGRKSNLLVLDSDEGGAATIATNGGFDATPAVSTGHGQHFYFTHPGFAISNAVRFLPGLDIRSDGGLVVAPPSIHVSEQQYKWTVASDRAIYPPAWLLDAYVQTRVAPAPTPQSDPTPSPAQGGASSPYALSALRGEVGKLERASSGMRNNQLNRAAFALGTLVGAGELDELFTIGELTSAGIATGLHPIEVARTIRSGLRAGILRPRQVAPPARPKER